MGKCLCIKSTSILKLMVTLTLAGALTFVLRLKLTSMAMSMFTMFSMVKVMMLIMIRNLMLLLNMMLITMLLSITMVL